MSFWSLSHRDFMHNNPILVTNRFDVVIFGVTGFAGRHVLLSAIEVLKEYRWAVAGRNREKIEYIMDDAMDQTQLDLTQVPIIIANCCDYRSLLNMAEQARLIVNCVGPYEDLGEQVIQACIASGTHMVDLCGEPHFMEAMQLKYHEMAIHNHVYIVQACGYESLLIDVGICLLEKNFRGTINSIEAYFEYSTLDNRLLSPIASGGAWSSFVMSCAYNNQLQKIRKKYRRKELPKLEPVLTYRPLIHETNIVSGVCIPMPLIDQQVVERTQYYFYEKKHKRPIQFHKYLRISNHIVGVFIFLWCIFVYVLAQLNVTRKLLLKYPRLFSLGLVSPRGPDLEAVDLTFFKIHLIACGWPSTGYAAHHKFEIIPEKKVFAKISGINPGYGVASICILSSVLVVLEDYRRMPATGGVYSPGSAFSRTKIINELEKYHQGPSFEIFDFNAINT